MQPLPSPMHTPCRKRTEQPFRAMKSGGRGSPAAAWSPTRLSRGLRFAVGVVGIGAVLVFLVAVAGAVAIRIRIQRIGVVLLITVVQSVAIGVGLVRVGPERGLLLIRQPIFVGIVRNLRRDRRGCGLLVAVDSAVASSVAASVAVLPAVVSSSLTPGVVTLPPIATTT